ncbi:MAG: iron-sulfur cluster repair di-iron protein [Alistipes sp.]|nr:iron-sulfur cluster repair di-iron protein [Alistipes sp.]
MNTSDFASKSVGAIVRDDFAAARVFKSFGIDFCCGGTATLADACRMAGVDVESVVAQLASKDEECGVIPFDMWPTDLLIDYVLKIHHRNIRAYGPELLALIEKVAMRHGSQHPELHDLVKLLAASLEDLESHLQKEEQVLFPYAYDLFYASERGEHARAMHCGTVANPIRVMHREHSDEGTRYKYIRNLTNGFAVPADACDSYRLMLHDLEKFMDGLYEHIHIENNILFPRFVELEQRTVMAAH